ncbi:MAG: alpha-galactosidase [Clostridia bacterium]|nr:alpha-galactosidase [Clostridia bacterium]
MLEKHFCFDERVFTVQSDKSLYGIEIKSVSRQDGIKIYSIEMQLLRPEIPCDAVIFWDEQPQGITGCWMPGNGRNRCVPQGWYPQCQYSTLTEGAPVLSLFNGSSENYRTVALSDSERPFEMSFWLKNDPGKDSLRIQISPFKKEAPGVAEYSFFLRIDERRLPLGRCISETSFWWRTFYPSDSRVYSEDFAGDKPLFSSWYACFQNPSQEVLEKELPVISDLGFRSMIIDDGWSYDGNGDGAYTNCGTWEIAKSKFPDMLSFVNKAHEYGIKVALWFPLPFVGKNNPDYRRFADKLLDETMGAGVLDPRYREVREYIVNNYISIIKKYGLDGLKLDFLTDFNRAAPENASGTDCKTVNEGITKLLFSIENEVRSLKSDMLIEYRAFYFGPSVIRRCNMLRMCDCAFDFITNRIGTVDIRMLDYPVSVHSDMLLWSPGETPRNIAVMLLNVLFSVPQISVLTADMNNRQRAVLKNYLSYWTSHRDILLHGTMTVKDPQANYSFVSASNKKLCIAVLYLPCVFVYDCGDTDIFNAGTDENIFIECKTDATAVCYDIYGSRTAEITLQKGLAKLPVAPGEKAELRIKPEQLYK